MSVKKRIKHFISFLLHGEPTQISAKVVALAPSELLKNRCALITGGTSGIGFSIAEAYLKAGISAVVITGRKQEKIDAACEKLSKSFLTFTILQLSISLKRLILDGAI